MYSSKTYLIFLCKSWMKLKCFSYTIDTFHCNVFATLHFSVLISFKGWLAFNKLGASAPDCYLAFGLTAICGTHSDALAFYLTGLAVRIIRYAQGKIIMLGPFATTTVMLQPSGSLVEAFRYPQGKVVEFGLCNWGAIRFAHGKLVGFGPFAVLTVALWPRKSLVLNVFITLIIC